ncbi:hypothetical protein FPZ12_031090 [Amycolatopsis acidicola]|uniref:DUF4345 domain-containing protein n=1 Tax=Amycolatopsis acidicola TaxID=2596893 RepID=A0A5N0UTX6_9PSEU|nr:hypothetical protein [Amycolatopsis acidicola]KAA9154808.1 hypothetical protein FPZ12_031090 [Amycolatopsis acidicola]
MTALRGENLPRALLVLLGVLTMLPVLALADASVLETSYGVTDPEPMTLALLQHRGMLQLLLGAMIVWAAFHRPARVPAAIAAVLGKGTFLALILSDVDLRAEVPWYTVVFDALCIVVLTTVAIVDGRNRAARGLPQAG